MMTSKVRTGRRLAALRKRARSLKRMTIQEMLSLTKTVT